MGKFKEINKPQSMRETQIMAYLSALSTIIHLDKDKAIDIANGLESLSDEEVIKRLAEFTYENIKNDFELLDYYLDLLMNINPNAIKSVDALKKDLIQEYQNQHSDEDVKDNHALISSTLRQMADLLNKEAKSTQEKMSAYFGKLEKFKQGSEEYKQGEKYIENYKNYISPFENLELYRTQIIEKDAYNAGKISYSIPYRLKSIWNIFDNKKYNNGGLW